VAAGHPALPVSRHTYTLHDSGIGRILLWNPHPSYHRTRLFPRVLQSSVRNPRFLRSKYDCWGRRSDLKNMYEYYDMRIGQVVELSGSDYHDQCVVIERDMPISIGFGIFCPTRIMRHIDAMRASDK